MLNGSAQPEGLSAILYHGLIGGLQIMFNSPAEDKPQTVSHSAVAAAASTDQALLRLMTNMVLHIQSEVTHVY